MLKFQEEYSIAYQSFEDFILVIFVLVDDLYKKVAPDSIKYRRNFDKALLSDSEIITIALCGEIIGVDSENAWHSLVKKISDIFFQECANAVNSIAPAEIYQPLLTKFLSKWQNCLKTRFLLRIVFL